MYLLVISRPAPLHSHCRVWLAVAISKQHFAEGRFRCLCTARCSSFLLCLRTGLTWESCPRSRRTLQRQNKSCILLDLMTSTSSYDFNNLQDLTRSYKSFGADRPAPEKSENPSTCPGALLPRQLLLLLKFHGGLAWSGSQRTAQNVGHEWS